MIKLKNQKKLIWLIVIAEIALYIVMLWFSRQDIVFFYGILQSEPNLINFLIYLSMFLIPLLGLFPGLLEVEENIRWKSLKSRI